MHPVKCFQLIVCQASVDHESKWKLSPALASKNGWNQKMEGTLLYYLRRPHNFAKSPPYFCLQYIQSKERWRFLKILWPSQNIWTLVCDIHYRFGQKEGKIFGILLLKLFWPTFRKKCSSEWEKLWKLFEITRTIHSNGDRSGQFLVTECFFNFKLEKFIVV